MPSQNEQIKKLGNNSIGKGALTELLVFLNCPPSQIGFVEPQQLGVE